MMDNEKLKYYALLVEKAIEENRGKRKDVDHLMEFDSLFKAIEDAKAGRIDSPRDFPGLNRWLVESNLREVSILSDRLAGFLILLLGWKLPEERNETSFDEDSSQKPSAIR